MNSSLKEIGRINRPHGVRGELKVSMDVEAFKNISSVKALYFKEGSSFVPYFVEKIHITSNQSAIIKFESFNSPESAQLVAGYIIYSNAEDLLEENLTDEMPFEDYENFQIYDQNLGLIGTIKEVIRHPHQIFAVVDHLDAEHLIPLHPDLVEEVNENDKIIVMNLPEGILDL